MDADSFNCNILNYLISRIHEEDTKFGVKYICDKISITEEILMNYGLLVSWDNFYEEECQFSLLNWAYELCRNEGREEDRKQKEVLLNNILRIFEIFPIKPTDLISLNFIRMLNKVKHSLKCSNIFLYHKTKQLANYWSQIVCYYAQVSSGKQSYLASKRIVEERRDKAVVNRKKVSWVPDDNLVDFVDYDPNEELCHC